MPQRATLIENVRVFDGWRVVGESASVLIEGNKISRVFPSSNELSSATLDVERIDGSGKTLLPGLIDAHVHSRESCPEHAILFGVTTELDMMSFPESMIPMRRDAAKRMDMADLRSCSISCTITGGWPNPLTDIGLIRKFPSIPNVDAVAEHIRARVEDEEADYIKLLVDNRLWHGGLPTMGMDMVEEIVRNAHKYNKLAICHIHDISAAIEVVKHGVDGLAHLYIDQIPNGTQEFVEACLQRGKDNVFVVPTLTLLGSLTCEALSIDISHHPQVLKYAAPSCIETLRNDASVWGYHKQEETNVRHAWAATRALHEAGIPVLVGTDSLEDMVPSIAHGVTVHNEMWQYVDECGFTPMEALSAATSQTAKAFRMPDRGTIEPGKLADLLLVEGDPTTDIRKTLDIVDVWRGGQKLDREKARVLVHEGFAKKGDKTTRNKTAPPDNFCKH